MRWAKQNPILSLGPSRHEERTPISSFSRSSLLSQVYKPHKLRRAHEANHNSNSHLFTLAAEATSLAWHQP